MFGVFREDSDGCTYTCETLLFITQTEDAARDFVILAKLELEEASNVERPTWSLSEFRDKRDRVVALREAYEQKINAMFTVDTTVSGDYLVSSGEYTHYLYRAVEVR